MLAPVGGAALILMFTRPGGMLARALSWRPVALIGLISYSAYLWHQPIFALARIRLDAPPSGTLMTVLFAATLAIGWLSWRFIERPFRRPTPGARVFAASAAGLAALALIGGVGWGSQGLLPLKTDALQRAYLASAQPSPKRNACHTDGPAFTPPEQSCVFFAPHASWAVLGDSHGVELSYALARALQPRGIGVRQLTFSGCAPSYQTGGATPCARWTDQAVRMLIADPGITTVAISYRLDMHLAEGPAPVWQAYRTMAAALAAAGKQVQIIRQALDLPAPMRDMAMAGGGAAIPARTLAEWEARRAYVTARLSDLPPGALIIDPATAFCAGARCLAGQGGVSYYFDANHMSVAGAGKVARMMIDRVLNHGEDMSALSGVFARPKL
jgi:hypothetical protein